MTAKKHIAAVARRQNPITIPGAHPPLYELPEDSTPPYLRQLRGTELPDKGRMS